MSPTLILAICILGFDALIYAFVHRIYGESRSAIARQVAALRQQFGYTRTGALKPRRHPEPEPLQA